MLLQKRNPINNVQNKQTVLEINYISYSIQTRQEKKKLQFCVLKPHNSLFHWIVLAQPVFFFYFLWG